MFSMRTNFGTRKGVPLIQSICCILALFLAKKHVHGYGIRTRHNTDTLNVKCTCIIEACNEFIKN